MAQLDPARLAEHLDGYSAETQELVRVLRAVILKAAPGVEEDVRFRSLCYFRPGARFGSIGGNVCMIEVREGRVVLSFIHGARLPDPAGMLRGSGKAKRYVEIASARDAKRREVAALVRAAAKR